MRTTSYFVMALGVFFVVIGWVVDGGGQLTAHQQATTLAQDAARVGVNSITGQAVSNGTTRVDQTAARAAALQYVAAAGADATVSVTPDTIEVTVTTTYQAKFAQYIGLTTLTAKATASAQLIDEGP